MTATAYAEEAAHRNKPRKKTPKLRDGVMKRGNTWSYVIRIKDPETGISKPKWVGGFATEDEAKAARDEGRIKARHGEYIDRNRITVTAYLDDWIDAHAMEIKPRTLADYRACIRRHAAHRPLAHPGCSPFHHHQAVPRPADQRRPRRPAARRLNRNPPARGPQEGVPRCRHCGRTHWQQSRGTGQAATSAVAGAWNRLDDSPAPGVPDHRETTPAVRLLPRRGLHRSARGELLNLRWTDIDLDAKKITITGSTAVIGGERVNGTTKSGRTRVVSIDDETVTVLRQRNADQAAEQLQAGDSWRGTRDGHVFTTGWGEPIYPDTVTSLMTKLIRAHNEPDQGPRPKDQLPHARLPDLRHLHATTLLLSGVPVHVVAARLGHADPAITLRVYAHVIRGAEAAAADIFAHVVKSA